MDFPGLQLHKSVISPGSYESIGVAMISAGTSAPTSATWPSANLGIYVPFTITTSYRAKKLWWANGGTATGNVDCAIYTIGGTRLVSAGPTAQGTINVTQTVSITELLLEPGSYYMALSSSSASATFFRWAPGAAQRLVGCGLAQQASVGTLPATATFATYAQTYVPVFGISSGVV